jgi:hypothetical protein
MYALVYPFEGLVVTRLNSILNSNVIALPQPTQVAQFFFVNAIRPCADNKPDNSRKIKSFFIKFL